MASKQYDDMDEAEEEALLKSDDEHDGSRVAIDLHKLPPPEADEDSLMREADELEDQTNVGEGISADDSDSDGDGDDDDVDDDDDENLDETAKILLEYTNTLKSLEENQHVYDKYVRLCELAHATNDFDKIRNAYQLFASVYPLTTELWLKYLSIEANLALSPTEMDHVEKLFRRALKDYYSIEIALEFSSLASRCADPGKIWKELLGTYGINCMKGQEFFRRYRIYLAEQMDASNDVKQEALVQSYLFQLRYPLNEMTETYIEFKVYYEKNKQQLTDELDWKAIDATYYKAKKDLEIILPFEQQLIELDSKLYRERMEVYSAYVKATEKSVDENVFQTICERMVADCWQSVDHWLTYIYYLEQHDEYGRPEKLQDLPLFKQTAMDVTQRALRNCPWSEKLYVKWMQLLEDQEDSTREAIQEVLETSMSAGIQTPEPIVTIWLEYLTYLRRHTDWTNDDECDILRKNFSLAWTILGQQWGVLADSNCEILQFWGRLEYGPLNDPERGKKLWTTVMESSDNATKSGLWIEFTQLEGRRDLASTRRLFQKALYSEDLDNPQVIASAWERFERCNGNIKTLNACLNHTSEFIAQYQQAIVQRQPTRSPSKNLNKSGVGGKGVKRRTTSSGRDDSVSSKKKPKSAETIAPTLPKKEAVFKEHENQEIDLTKDHLRIFVSNLDYNLNEEDIRGGLPELKIVSVDLIRSGNGKSRGFGYLEVENEAEVEKALAMDRRSLNGRPIFISSVLRDKEKRQKFKYSDSMEPKKLFVKSLPQDTTKEELEKIFGAFGKLQDVRLVYHKSGKFKNIAYVEFEEESSAGKATLAIDRMELRGHVVSVAISAPPPKPTTSAGAITINKYLTKIVKPSEQKPRMSLIPNVVRKKFTPSSTVSGPSTSAVTTNGAAAPPKSNEDFRKLLMK